MAQSLKTRLLGSLSASATHVFDVSSVASSTQSPGGKAMEKSDGKQPCITYFTSLILETHFKIPSDTLLQGVFKESSQRVGFSEYCSVHSSFICSKSRTNDWPFSARLSAKTDQSPSFPSNPWTATENVCSVYELPHAWHAALNQGDGEKSKVFV